MRLRVVSLLTLVCGFFLLLLLQPVSAHAADPTPTPSPTAETPSAGATAQPPADGSYIGVRLQDFAHQDADGTPAPVPGVSISVEDQDGTEVGSSTSDAVGAVYIPIPGNGTYTVRLDPETLPDGAVLTGDKSTTHKVQVLISGGKFVQFTIGYERPQGAGFFSKLKDNVLSGVKSGLIIALAALGLSMIFGTTGLTNFAHGELVTFGALAAYFFNVTIGLPLILAGLLAMVAGGVFGYAQDAVLWRPLRKRGTGVVAMMIVSIGLGLFLRSIYQYYFGGARRTLRQYVNQRERSYGPFDLAPKEVAIIVIAVVVIALVCIAIARTRIGKAMRAVADNPALAASSGMRVDGVISVVWIVGTALTALSGTLLALDQQVDFQSGFRILLLVFAAVTLGGLGTVWGALIGSIVIGIFVEVGPQLFGVPQSIKEVGALGVLILILLIRPQGILGRAQRVG